VTQPFITNSSSVVDILILANGPGEVTTWVRPVVRALRQQLGNDSEQVRISIILSPCPHATGKEADICRSYEEVDRVQESKYFWQFLLQGKTAQNWQWRDRGVVLFLGGDSFFPVVIGKRLNYRTVVYAEWETRWHRWIDRFGVMQPQAINPKFAHKCQVVGDLMLEAAEETKASNVETEVIGLLPGSKAAKLAQGVPLLLAIAEFVSARRPQTRFAIPVAPTIDLETLANFANPQFNSVIESFGGVSATLIFEPPRLKTSGGLEVDLWMKSPAYELLSQCSICLTTVGANTAELGALAIPMIVLLPTQQLDAMRSWDGIPGLLAALPMVGTNMAKLINWSILHLPRRLYAWPNIWAKSEVVPELVGNLQPEEVAAMVLDYLEHPEKLQQISEVLRSIRGESGAAQKLASLVKDELVMGN
jgi:lipid A disaccharide synthetase